jgi:hypothetical protein
MLQRKTITLKIEFWRRVYTGTSRSRIIQIFQKKPKTPVYSLGILNNPLPFRKTLVIFPKNPKIPLIFSKILNILKNPQNSQKSTKFTNPKIPLIFLKIPKNAQISTKFWCFDSATKFSNFFPTTPKTILKFLYSQESSKFTKILKIPKVWGHKKLDCLEFSRISD